MSTHLKEVNNLHAYAATLVLLAPPLTDAQRHEIETVLHPANAQSAPLSA